jgi:hypothetical protein
MVRNRRGLVGFLLIEKLEVYMFREKHFRTDIIILFETSAIVLGYPVEVKIIIESIRK